MVRDHGTCPGDQARDRGVGMSGVADATGSERALERGSPRPLPRPRRRPPVTGRGVSGSLRVVICPRASDTGPTQWSSRAASMSAVPLRSPTPPGPRRKPCSAGSRRGRPPRTWRPTSGRCVRASSPPWTPSWRSGSGWRRRRAAGGPCCTPISPGPYVAFSYTVDHETG